MIFPSTQENAKKSYPEQYTICERLVHNLWQIKLNLNLNTSELKKKFNFGLFDMPEIQPIEKETKPMLTYTKLKKNKALPPIKMGKLKNTDDNPCACDVESPCTNYGCLNRLRRVECESKNCQLTTKYCENRRFKNYAYPKLSVEKIKNKGWGLMAEENITAGDFVIEYVGELINKRECDRRLQLKEKRKDENYYVLPIGDIFIDSNRKGNDARFINHSCKPNCEIQYWRVNGIVCAGVFALNDIPEVKVFFLTN